MSSSFGSLRTDTELCDITLVSEDEEPVLAHKVVLSTCSKFFQTLLCKLSGPNAVAYLGGVKTRHLHYVLDYIYLGEVNIEDENVDIFLELAKKFKLQGFERHKGLENTQENSGLIKPKEESLEVIENVLVDNITISEAPVDDERANDNTVYRESHPKHNETLREKNKEQDLNAMNNMRHESPTTNISGSNHEADQQKVDIKREDDNCFDSEESFDLEEDLEDLLADNENVVEEAEFIDNEEFVLKVKSTNGQIQWEEKISNLIQEKLKKSEVNNKIKRKYNTFDMSNVQILLGDKIVTLNDLESLLENMVLKKGNVFKCKGCEYTHNHRSSLKYHSETHIKKLKIVCSICKYPCSTRQALRVHMKIKH